MKECRIGTAVAVVLALQCAGLISAQNVVLSFPYPHLNPTYGESNAALGDVSGDGVPDFALGWPGANQVHIRSGFDGTLIATIALQSCCGVNFGSSIDVGDVNGDSVVDLIIGTPLCNTIGERVSVYLGPNWVLGMHVYHPQGPGMACLTSFGEVVRFVGDVNNDGSGDFLVFATDYRPYAPGWVYLFSGANGTLLNTFAHGWGYRNFMDRVGDFDHDGCADFIIARPQYGKAFIHSGATGTVLQVVGPGYPPVAGLGDIDGDGTPDVVMGKLVAVSPNLTVPGTGVFSGATGALISQHTGTPVATAFVKIVAPVGDVNGNGYGDYVSGSWGWFGVIDSWTGLPLYQATGNYFRESQIGVGDLTGDGVQEILVAVVNPTGVQLGRVEVHSPVTVPTASVMSLGGGCGTPGAPVLIGTPPAFRTTSILSLSGRPGASGIVVVGFPAAAPWPLVPGCIVHVEAPTAVVFTSLVTDALGAWTMLVPIGQPAPYVGVELVFQAALTAPLGPEISNALRVTLGL